MSSMLKTSLLPAFSNEKMETTSEIIGESALEKSRLRILRERTAAAIFTVAAKISKKDTFPTGNSELANEHKATRVLAVVFACFFICWTPFFVANFAVGFCGARCAVPPTVASFFLWLGYFSSTINPLIYTIFNRRFRQAFLRILRCQCTHPLRGAYVGSYLSHRLDDGW
ncbi:unnamed protein product [Gongylonema pulchrum]|uniref:G_PROTEIN_RECEP_F1_2 domain-containing protein n=1 Tax=Gongylonema pulchrum TaxID=637853 RepID=A0A183EIY4_9BILA|nr:unnamed protein product [Gongylonema pulchrum]